MSASKKFDFDNEIQKLEAIVEQMESGELGLEQAMAQFEQGVKITRECHKALQEVEQKVQILLEKQGKMVLEPFDVNGDDN